MTQRAATKGFKAEDYTVNGVDVSSYMMSLQGRDYLQVAGRLVLFRDKYPQGCIRAALLYADNDQAQYRVEVFADPHDGLPLGTGHGRETRQGFPPGWYEKAETIALGRALAHAGFGTAYARADFHEVDAAGEATRPADAPLAPAATKPTPAPAPALDTELTF